MQDTQGLIFPDLIINNGTVYAFFTNRLFKGGPLSFISSDISMDARLYMPVQRHTDIVVRAEEVIDGPPAIADAVITNRPGLFIAIKTADCVPVLIYDPCRKVIGAVHAGWRGTVQWILSKTINHMGAQYGSRAKDLLVAIGPSIGACCYEVGPEVAEKIAEGRDKTCVMAKRGGYYADLQRANTIEALSLGVREDNIWCCKECTYCLPDRYHSYRYSKQQALRQYGIIGLLDSSILDNPQNGLIKCD